MCCTVNIFFNFTPYPSDSRIGKFYVTYFPLNLEGMTGGTQRRAFSI